jgi:hypothetical protein
MSLDAISAASGGIASALDEVGQIEQQLQRLTSGTLLSSLAGVRSRRREAPRGPAPRLALQPWDRIVSRNR